MLHGESTERLIDPDLAPQFIPLIAGPISRMRAAPHPPTRDACESRPTEEAGPLYRRQAEAERRRKEPA
jgi:hypothetical protein